MESAGPQDFDIQINLQEAWLILKRRWLPALAVFVAVTAVGATPTLLEAPSFIARGTLQFVTDRASQLTGVGSEFGSLDSPSRRANPLETEALVLQSDELLSRMIERLDLRNAEGELRSPAGFKVPLTVNNLSGTDALRVAFRSGNPQLAADVVNTLMDLYIETNIRNNRAEAVAARQFISEQLPLVESELAETESALRRFKEDNQIISLQGEAIAVASAITGLQAQIQANNQTLADIEARLDQITQQLGLTPAEGLALAAVTQATGVQEVLAQLRQVETALLLQEARYTDNHPVIVELKTSQARLRQLLQQRIQEVLSEEQATVIPRLRSSNRSPEAPPPFAPESQLPESITSIPLLQETVSETLSQVEVDPVTAATIAGENPIEALDPNLPTLNLGDGEVLRSSASAQPDLGSTTLSGGTLTAPTGSGQLPSRAFADLDLGAGSSATESAATTGLILDEAISALPELPEFSDLSDPVERLETTDLEQALIGQLIEQTIARAAVVEKLETINQQLESRQERAAILPQLEQQQQELERRRIAAQTTYTTLLQRLQESQVIENKNVGNARIIEWARVPVAPLSQRRGLRLAVVVVLGMMLGGSTTLLLEVLDGSVKSVRDTKQIFDYDLLGTIPAWRKPRNRLWGFKRAQILQVPLRDLPRSALSESYRILQANLKFSSLHRPVRIMTITSSVPKEGRSTVAANLALALAELSSRVLLLEADLRCPQQQDLWHVKGSAGLSHVLVGQATLKQAIQPLSPHLDLISAGACPPNPIALLDSARMQSLLQNLGQVYDYIVIDTPPIAMTPDALILGKLSDGILMVVRPGIADKSSANSVRQAVEQSGQQIFGVVINGILLENEPDRYYYRARDRFHALTQHQASSTPDLDVTLFPELPIQGEPEDTRI